ncbi:MULTISPECIES: (d)CMP kinase [unclassified Clostridium]|uniref:(d)CMP kinase n=1 Tax=unclassified Clostridium TaxID=2614128 RepID=UPI00052C5EB5|nr:MULTISPECIES: (d)CMP kinase [unclassified Clostridium]KGK88567.1 cytidylate kinase [Clostridium sp. HMP27]
MKVAIAIDGPAGAGKSTIAKILATKFNLMYIDTGAMYRAVTLLAKTNDISPDNISALCTLLENTNMHFENNRLILNNNDVSEAIRTPEISNSVSLYAAISEVRTLLVKQQQKMSEKYDVIMDGRDIGTVVLKDAPFKFYLVASPELRAKRRYEELLAKNITVKYDEILSDIIKRDYIDSNRDVTPLRKAEDAIEIDTSYLTIDEVVEKISNIILNTLKDKER